MENNINNQSEKFKANFIFPDIESEIGEVERVAEMFAVGSEEEFVNKFVEKAKSTELVDLTEELWEKLENTDSHQITTGDWGKVGEITDHYNTSTNASRSYELLKTRLEQGEALYAPIIAKIKETLHLVSGNTRLMTARAAGIIPKVLIVEM